jgi:hypothetical protein
VSLIRFKLHLLKPAGVSEAVFPFPAGVASKATSHLVAMLPEMMCDRDLDSRSST